MVFVALQVYYHSHLISRKLKLNLFCPALPENVIKHLFIIAAVSPFNLLA
jgi:hypothetical protein